MSTEGRRVKKQAVPAVVGTAPEPGRRPGGKPAAEADIMGQCGFMSHAFIVLIKALGQPLGTLLVCSPVGVYVVWASMELKVSCDGGGGCWKVIGLWFAVLMSIGEFRAERAVRSWSQSEEMGHWA